MNIVSQKQKIMTVEEKARKYAGNLIPAESLYFDAEKISLNIENTFIESKYDAFISGYTQAVTDLNAENEKLREALREAYDLIVASTEYEVEIPRYREGLLKINELLKPNN